jgi:hypothetical protein
MISVIVRKMALMNRPLMPAEKEHSIALKNIQGEILLKIMSGFAKWLQEGAGVAELVAHPLANQRLFFLSVECFENLRYNTIRHIFYVRQLVIVIGNQFNILKVCFYVFFISLFVVLVSPWTTE